MTRPDDTLPLPEKTLREHGISTETPAFPPRRLGKYELMDKIGSGGFGDVYRYREPELGDRPVAIKFFHRDASESGRVHLAEARIAARFHHPNVIRVHGVDEWSGVPYIVYEYIAGDSLDTLTEVLDWREVRTIGLQLASGLAAVHRQGLLHRDIKPSNAILHRQDGEIAVTLIDFGAETSGTPLYWAPEVADHDHSRASDVYSLGLVLHQLCTGERPERPLEPGWYRAHPAIDPMFAAVIERCLDPEPGARYASGEALREALEPLYSPAELLGQAAEQWRLDDRVADYLWRRRQLARLVGSDLAGLPGIQREFIAASKRALRRSRWIRLTALAALVIGVAAVYLVVDALEERELARRVQAQMTGADEILATARRRHAEFDDLRVQALDGFRRGRHGAGEALWARVIKIEPEVGKLYSQASQKLEVAIHLDPASDDARRRLVEVLDERLRFTDDTLRHEDRDELLNRLSLHDTARHASWVAPVPVAIVIRPHDSDAGPAGESRPDGQTRYRPRFRIDRWLRSPDGHFATRTVVAIDSEGGGADRETGRTVRLEPGSYVVVVPASAIHDEVRYPFVVGHRSPPRDITIDLPDRESIPDGFVYVPPGQYFHGHGSRAEHEPARQWYNATPLHQRATGPFLIQRHETTFGQWIEFLDAHCGQPGCTAGCGEPGCGEDESYLIPRGDWGGEISIELRRAARPGGDGAAGAGARSGEDGPAVWTLHFRNGVSYASRGEFLIHQARERDERQAQRWRDLPVSAVSSRAAREYARWLSGEVPGARLCSEYEWERAARGADTRAFPHGDALEPHQANFDQTHGATTAATAGPDAVGSYPGSASPFGVLDMAGNVYEWTSSEFAPGGEVSLAVPGRDRLHVVRGGSFYTALISAMAMNRWKVPDSDRFANLGVRICADARR